MNKIIIEIIRKKVVVHLYCTLITDLNIGIYIIVLWWILNDIKKKLYIYI